jgi:uncharacterized membrane protein YdjX (TVP38/TMEM64 family)
MYEGALCLMNSNRNKLLFYAVAALCASVLCAALVWRLYGAELLALSGQAGRERLVAWVDSFGPAGIPVLFFIQLAQIVLAVLPGEPVEFAAGMLYGPFGGLILCLCGILAGSWCAHALAQRYGVSLVRRLVSAEKLARYTALGKTKRFERVVAVLFFLPGTPKDVLIYAVGLTQMPRARFFLIATLARIPSVLSSTMAGAAFGDGEFLRSGLLYLAAAALGGVGMLVHRVVMRRLEHHKAP